MSTTVQHAEAQATSRQAANIGIWSWLTTVDHKRIGILYGATAFLFFLRSQT
jgi:cytochrome c oxidase subunit 1